MSKIDLVVAVVCGFGIGLLVCGTVLLAMEILQ